MCVCVFLVVVVVVVLGLCLFGFFVVVFFCLGFYLWYEHFISIYLTFKIFRSLESHT